MTIGIPVGDAKSASGHRKSSAPHRVSRADLVLSSAAVAYVLVNAYATSPLTAPAGTPLWPGWKYIGWTAADLAAALTVLTRRRWPLLLVATAITAHFVVYATASVPIAFYTLISQRRYVWAGIGAAVYLVGSVMDFQPTLPADMSVLLSLIWGFEAIGLRQMAPFVFAPALVAIAVQEHRQRVDNLRSLNFQLRREQELVAQNAVLTERTRIAREMHDVVTHYVGLIVLRAGALEMTTGRTSEAGEGAHLIAELGRKTMVELRDLLQVLRPNDTGEELALSRAGEEPFDPDLTTLLDSARAAGMAVSWTTGDSLAMCPGPLRYAVYRIVQEALANAARHAPQAAVHVTVEQEADVLLLTVQNPLPTVAERQRGRTVGGSGLGLLGMRERAQHLHGTVESAITPDNQFRVRATFPLVPVSS
ncbi:histidine kinase [Streptomyces sp. NBC_00829]|uniref:sensor histidine kinase n=1 Tax=Streptomyces sp. NBC_00829 TaxID=2903679 RepID=UPI002F914805|nr:histidine kinase [Streptomyces sp. NBC_00829]